ncbi:glycosyl hydrolase family 18 protein [Synechococcus sp. WH 8101]|uniref:glycosyl hydrolase family 18 protein n=1 Tax=Synechococcus sp. WH 8101 TaxID=59932 RepID=UPI0020C436FA|nr:glycosyl hydrolase family 18 protein [Synechococcus sp. WH 8101]
MSLLPGGRVVSVNPSGSDLLGFDPSRDRLDFGEISVHGLILGKLADGSAVIVNPWQDADYQRILDEAGRPIRWDQLSLENIAPVGNEHLREDIGGVLSWELGVGPGSTWPNPERTVYVRSHEFGVQERVEGFDPSRDQLNFLYLGTRERLSAIDTADGLLISVQPSGQSLLLVGVESTDLVGRNLVFHFDQIEEDNLEAVFGFEAADLSLADRTILLTPEAVGGASTDGSQTRLGTDTTSQGALGLSPSEPMDHSGMDHSGMDHSGMDHSGMDHSGMDPADPLSVSVGGTLYWGGMSGRLTITNTGDQAVEDWSISFITPHRAFQSWAGDAQVEALTDGTYRVTLTPASWNSSIAAGASIEVSFNAASEGLPTSGTLTDALFFAGEAPQALEQPAPEVQEPVEVTPEPPALEQPDPVTPDPGPSNPVDPADPLSVSVGGTLYWGGMSGRLTITNTGDQAVEDWSISFITPHRAFQSWAGDAQVEALTDGTYRVTLTPASWNSSIAAGASIEVSFNAASEGLPTSGTLTDALFFAGEAPQAPEQPALEQPDPVTPDPGSEDPGSEAVTPDVANPEVPSPEVLSPKPIADQGQRVVAYFEEWGIYARDFLVQDIKADQLTHLNYSFFDVKANGDINLFDAWAATDKRFSVDEQVNRTFTASEWSALPESRLQAYRDSGDFHVSTNGDGSVSVRGVPVSWDSSTALAGNLRQLDLLKQLNPNLNLGLALGGWTLSDEFSLALDDAAGREQFTDNVILTLEKYDFFNTVDFDWEYPGGGGLAGNAASAEDGANFAMTLSLLRQKLDALEQRSGESYSISIATAGGADKLANLNLPGIDPSVDFYNVMAYDFHGGWESVTGHQAAMTNDPGGYDVLTAVEQFRSNGVDLSKVVLGVPAYTRAWGGVEPGEQYGLGESGTARMAPGSFEAGSYDQKDLLTGIEDGSYDLIWDDDAKASFAYNEQTGVWSSVETAATIAGKAAYVEAQGLGGLMFWALSNDSSGNDSLIAAASDLLRAGVAPEDVLNRGVSFDAVLGGDGQFGLSDFTSLV